MTVELLRSATRVGGGRYTYQELATEIGLPVTMLSRYAKGHVLPNSERSREIWRVLNKLVGLREEIQKILLNEEGYFEDVKTIGNINLLRQAANHALARFAGKRVTKILTANLESVPLATMVADLFGINLILAKENRTVGISEYIEETHILGNTGILSALYLPRNAIERRDSVLIVDFSIRNGEIQKALINLVRKARAEISGIYSLLAIGNEWRKKIDLRIGTEVEIIQNFEIK